MRHVRTSRTITTRLLALGAGLALAPLALAQNAGAANARTSNQGGVMAAAEQNTPLPISRITLYRSGVASFQRAGSVTGDATVQLRFTTEQINDILKSMVVLDMSGGDVAGASYPSKEPLERRLASFGVDISGNPSIADLLTNLRGSPVTVQTTEGPISGTILGVEQRVDPKPGPSPAGAQVIMPAPPVSVPFLTLVTGTGIRAVNLHTVSGFTLDDKDLAAELGKALAALAEHRADRTKTVDITLRGQGARDVVVNYVHEMPVWKTSYRLVLPDPGAGRNEAGDPAMTPTIQGWAHVENTTDEDWNDVRLALVSGRPVSFTMDLYEPLYLARPEVPVPTIPGVLPRSYAGGVPGAPEMDLIAVMSESAGQSPFQQRNEGVVLMGSGARSRGGAPAPASAPMDAFSAGRPVSGEDMTKYAAQAQARGVEAGEVFQFELSAPVSVPRQRSAMLPIIATGIEGRRVSIFNAMDGSEHPMRGVELTNSTGLQLLPGPIAVFDGGTYAGDATIGHVPTGDKRLLAYAVDLDVTTLREDRGSAQVQKLRVVRGLIEMTQKTRSETTYRFVSKDEKRARTIVLEHPRDGSMTLVAPQKADEETQELYRFRLELPAKKDASITVAQERVDTQTLALLNFDLNTLVAYQRQGAASEGVVKAFRDAAAKRDAVGNAAQRVAQLEKERMEIAEDQARIRANMGGIDRASELYARYMQTLNQQETRLEALRTEVAQARAEQQRLQRELEAFLATLNVE